MADTGYGMAGSMYSVTLTGKVRPGKDAPAVWERVGMLLKLDAASLRERMLARLPVTLKAVDFEAAKRQLEALTSAGADALMLDEDAAPRVWIRDAQRTCGPLSMAFVRHALREGMLPPDAPACAQGSKQWLDLESLADNYPPPAAPVASARADKTAKPTRPRRRATASGRSSAAIVIIASLVLVAVLALLLARSFG